MNKLTNPKEILFVIIVFNVYFQLIRKCRLSCRGFDSVLSKHEKYSSLTSEFRGFST